MSTKGEVHDLLAAIIREFPEVAPVINRIDQTLVCDRLEYFARLTDEAIEAGRLEQAGAYMAFVESRLKTGTKALASFIDTYYAEVLLFHVSETRRPEGWALMPVELRTLHRSCWPMRSYVG